MVRIRVLKQRFSSKRSLQFSRKSLDIPLTNSMVDSVWVCCSSIGFSPKTYHNTVFSFNIMRKKEWGGGRERERERKYTHTYPAMEFSLGKDY